MSLKSAFLLFPLFIYVILKRWTQRMILSGIPASFIFKLQRMKNFSSAIILVFFTVCTVRFTFYLQLKNKRRNICLCAFLVGVGSVDGRERRYRLTHIHLCNINLHLLLSYVSNIHVMYSYGNQINFMICVMRWKVLMQTFIDKKLLADVDMVDSKFMKH